MDVVTYLEYFEFSMILFIHIDLMFSCIIIMEIQLCTMFFTCKIPLVLAVNPREGCDASYFLRQWKKPLCFKD